MSHRGSQFASSPSRSNKSNIHSNYSKKYDDDEAMKKSLIPPPRKAYGYQNYLRNGGIGRNRKSLTSKLLIVFIILALWQMNSFSSSYSEKHTEELQSMVDNQDGVEVDKREKPTPFPTPIPTSPPTRTMNEPMSDKGNDDAVGDTGGDINGDGDGDGDVNSASQKDGNEEDTGPEEPIVYKPNPEEESTGSESLTVEEESGTVTEAQTVDTEGDDPDSGINSASTAKEDNGEEGTGTVAPTVEEESGTGTEAPTVEGSSSDTEASTAEKESFDLEAGINSTTTVKEDDGEEGTGTEAPTVEEGSSDTEASTAENGSSDLEAGINSTSTVKEDDGEEGSGTEGTTAEEESSDTEASTAENGKFDLKARINSTSTVKEDDGEEGSGTEGTTAEEESSNTEESTAEEGSFDLESGINSTSTEASTSGVEEDTSSGENNDENGEEEDSAATASIVAEPAYNAIEWGPSAAAASDTAASNSTSTSHSKLIPGVWNTSITGNTTTSTISTPSTSTSTAGATEATGETEAVGLNQTQLAIDRQIALWNATTMEFDPAGWKNASTFTTVDKSVYQQLVEKAYDSVGSLVEDVYTDCELYILPTGIRLKCLKDDDPVLRDDLCHTANMCRVVMNETMWKYASMGSSDTNTTKSSHGSKKSALLTVVDSIESLRDIGIRKATMNKASYAYRSDRPFYVWIGNLNETDLNRREVASIEPAFGAKCATKELENSKQHYKAVAFLVLLDILSSSSSPSSESIFYMDADAAFNPAAFDRIENDRFDVFSNGDGEAALAPMGPESYFDISPQASLVGTQNTNGKILMNSRLIVLRNTRWAKDSMALWWYCRCGEADQLALWLVIYATFSAWTMTAVDASEPSSLAVAGTTEDADPGPVQFSYPGQIFYEYRAANLKLFMHFRRWGHTVQDAWVAAVELRRKEQLASGIARTEEDDYDYPVPINTELYNGGNEIKPKLSVALELPHVLILPQYTVYFNKTIQGIAEDDGSISSTVQVDLPKLSDFITQSKPLESCSDGRCWPFMKA